MKSRNRNIQALLDSFKTDLEQLPNEQCVLVKNKKKDKEQLVYTLNLEDSEYQIFDKLTLRLNPDGTKYYEFTAVIITPDFMKRLDQLTNSLYEILKDGTVSGTGKLNETDKYIIQKHGFWPGKIWIDYNTSSMILLEVSDNKLKLNIIDNGI